MIIAVPGIIIFTISTISKDFEGGTSKKYQHDADIARLNHLVTVAGYIEEYKEKTGHYPLADRTTKGIPNFTLIGLKENQDSESIPMEHTRTSQEELEKELSRVLERDITLPIDPQTKRNNERPLIYIYMTSSVEEDYYYFSVMTHNEYSFTRKISEFYNVLEVSSEPNAERNVKTYQQLLEDEDFQRELTKEPYNEGYFNY